MIMTRNLGGVLSYQFGSTYASNQKLAIYQDLSGFNIDTPPATLTAGYGFQQLAAVDVSGSGVDALVKVNYDIEKSSESLKLAIYNNIDNLNFIRNINMRFLLEFMMVLLLVLVNENFCLEILMATERWSY